jgi:8-oxo-dGTP pyrophosphatase MutT (NUDIX family)
MWVFPGGQVDRSDAVSDRGDDREVEMAAARRAAVREAYEEAGLALDVSELVPLSHWVPPPQAPRRFSTWFFLARVGVGAPVVVDDSEIHEYRWCLPAAAMADRNDGRLDLAMPTFTTLWWLSRQTDVAATLAALRGRPPERFLSHLAFDSEGNTRAALWDGDAGYADADLERPGPRRRLWLDPVGWRVEINV